MRPSVVGRQGNDDLTHAAARVGRTLRDKWHLDALIDVGGMAAVYAATHRNGMRGAVKILHPHRSMDSDIAARFRREGYIANRVGHPNAVRVLDDDLDDDGSAFLVMELLEGATLRERAEAHGGRLSADEVLLAVDQLLDVLAVAHDAGIIHRDVKPDNVMITASGHLKILDFGIARLGEPSAQQHSGTLAGLPLGSPAFMSPEQARGRWDLVDVQSDVWSVGATMFTLLSGRDVHAAGTVPELLAAIFRGPAPRLSTALPDVHPALAAVVDRALQLRLADRWPDARAMQAAARYAYRSIFRASLPTLAPTVRATRPTSQPDEEPGEAQEVRCGSTTVFAPDISRRATPRRVALLSSILFLAILGFAGAERDSRPASSPLARASAAPRSEAAVPKPSEAVEPEPETPSLAPAPVLGALGALGALRAPPSPQAQPPPLKTPAPASRSRLPAIYDRRN